MNKHSKYGLQCYLSESYTEAQTPDGRQKAFMHCLHIALLAKCPQSSETTKHDAKHTSRVNPQDFEE